MLVLAGLAAGAAVGALRARARGGDRADMAQYAAVHALILGVLALFATISLLRSGG